ncbi:MAG: helix-turn-helix transcriptional regulator [Ignavibacteriales bacterium]|nr:helix-turn-helix transcriptional regulator [Ignavibacteriales bacterium]MBK8947270.1 helix-turn-helix transcriptional regulator [Ignavibacteriota bacterium]
MKTEISRPCNIELSKICNTIWQVNGIPFYQKEIILPSGYVEIIFNLSDDVKFINRKTEKISLLPKFFINGINTHTVCIIPQGHHTFLGIQLSPMAVKCLFNIPAYKLTNEAIELSEIFPNSEYVWYKLMEANNFNERKQIILFELLCLMENNKKKNEILCFIKALESLYFENLTILEMNKMLNISSRQLHRKALDFLGTNPEFFIKYQRFLKSIKLIYQNQYTLTEIAYSCNYFDQSHFTKDFTEFAGITPFFFRKKIQEFNGTKGHFYY